MKRLHYITFHLFSLNILLISIFTQNLFGQIPKQTKTKLDYCLAFKHLKNLQQSVFKTQALLSYSTVSRVDGGDSFLYSAACNSGDYFAITNFSQLVNSNKWQKFFSGLSKEKNFVFEIQFKGKLKTSIVPFYGHLAWSLAEMEIIEIESIKEITNSSSKPNFQAETPLTNAGETLSFINTEVTRYFLQARTEKDINEYLANSYRVINADGNTFNKTSYQKLAKNGIFNQEEILKMSISNGKVRKIGSKFKVFGIITVTDKNNNERIINYMNTFDFQYNSWILIETKFSKL